MLSTNVPNSLPISLSRPSMNIFVSFFKGNTPLFFNKTIDFLCASIPASIFDLVFTVF